MRQTVSISELHRLTSIDRATIGKQIKHLIPVGEGPKNARTYYLDEVLTAMVHAAKGRNEDSSKSRKELAEAEKAELTVAKLRGEVIPTDLVRTTAADLVKSLYQRCVRLAPKLVADKVTGNQDRGEVEIAIREHMAQIFDELRSLPNKFLNLKVEDADGDSKAI